MGNLRAVRRALVAVPVEGDLMRPEPPFKVRRYAARRNPEDLAKVAAWAYLMWRFDRPDAGSPDVRGTVSERPNREER